MRYHEMDPELLGALREVEILQAKNQHLEEKNLELQEEAAGLRYENRMLDKENSRLIALLEDRKRDNS